MKGIKLMLALALAVLLIAAFALPGCAPEVVTPPPPAEEEEEEEVPPEEVEPLLLAGPLCLTGPVAKNAEKVRLAYEDWAEYINETEGGLLGRPVELRIYDDEFSIDLATEYYEKAITVDHCDFMLPTYEGHVGRAVMGIADKYKMLYTGMGGHLESFSQGFTYVASAPPLMGESWAMGMADLLLEIPEEERPELAFIMTAKLTIYEACAKSIRSELIKAGIPYEERFYTLPLMTADPLILEARDMGADFLILNGGFPDGVLGVEAAAKYGYEPKAIWQSVGCPDPEWMSVLGSKGNLAFTGSIWYPGLPYEGNDLIAELWAEKHAAEFGEDIAIYYGFGWNWVKTVELGVKGAQSFDQTEVRDWLHSNVLHLPSGDFLLDARGIPAPFNLLVQWQDGKLECIWPPGPAKSAEFVYPHPGWQALK